MAFAEASRERTPFSPPSHPLMSFLSLCQKNNKKEKKWLSLSVQKLWTLSLTQHKCVCVFVMVSVWVERLCVCVCVRWGDFYIQRKKCARSCVHSLGSSLLPSFPPWKERVHREQQMSRHWPLWWQKAQAVVKRTHWAVIPALHHLPIIKAAASCPPTSKQTRDLPSRRGMVV